MTRRDDTGKKIDPQKNTRREMRIARNTINLPSWVDLLPFTTRRRADGLLRSLVLRALFFVLS